MSVLSTRRLNMYHQECIGDMKELTGIGDGKVAKAIKAVNTKVEDLKKASGELSLSVVDGALNITYEEV